MGVEITAVSLIIVAVKNFHLTEVNIIKAIIFSKFNISFYLIKTSHLDINRGYILKIPFKEVH